jgi:DNA mismatch repair protein MLH3
VDEKFLVCKLRDQIVILDQHAVDERVQLEFLLKKFHETQKVNLTLPLTSRDQSNIKQHVDALMKWGIIIDGCVAKQLPTVLVERCTVDVVLLYDALIQHVYHLMEGGVNVMPIGVLHILHSNACRSAIMFGKRLSKEQCIALIDKWKVTEVFSILK